VWAAGDSQVTIGSRTIFDKLCRHGHTVEYTGRAIRGLLRSAPVGLQSFIPAGETTVSDPRTGGCLCSEIRYEMVGEPVFSLRCHCRDCQRQSGAAHVPAARMPSAGFRILTGTPKRYLTKSDSGNDIVRFFCGDCGTPLYVQVGTRPDLVGIRVCTLDDPSWFKPDADIFVKSAQPWDHDQPNAPKYDTYPPGQSYPTAPSREN
jgi:hypothetical protein